MGFDGKIGWKRLRDGYVQYIHRSARKYGRAGISPRRFTVVGLLAQDTEKQFKQHPCG